MIGVYHKDKMILGNNLKAGQKAIVFRDVLRDNGTSTVRKALKMNFGKEWFSNPDAQEIIEQCATPSVLYDKMFNEMNGWYNGPEFEKQVNIHLIAHLSGGAFKSKLGEDLLEPQGLSAVLPDLFEPAPILQKIKQWRGMNDEEAYATFNCGQGALAVVDDCDVDAVLQRASFHKIEAKVAGEIIQGTKSSPNVSIKSQFPGGDWIH
jgi:phosphoribosylformylglycinamidine cyclo-ligase